MTAYCPLYAAELLEAMKEQLEKFGNHANITVEFREGYRSPEVQVPTGRPPVLIIPVK